MTRAVVIMGLVALVAGVLGIVALVGTPKSEAAVYRRRITGTMLIALSVVLVANAVAQQMWRVEP